MTTGLHIVRDIYCCKCGTTLGWKYVRIVRFLFRTPALVTQPPQDRAFEASQRYKEGKYILERNLLVTVE